MEYCESREMNLFTYADLKTPTKRDVLLSRPVSSIGTKGGGFGYHTEQARILTKSGAETVAEELKLMCKQEGLDYDSVLEFAPTLLKLIK